MAGHQIKGSVNIINDGLRPTELKDRLSNLTFEAICTLGYLAIKYNSLINEKGVAGQDSWETAVRMSASAVAFIGGMSLGSIITNNDKIYQLK